MLLGNEQQQNYYRTRVGYMANLIIENNFDVISLDRSARPVAMGVEYLLRRKGDDRKIRHINIGQEKVDRFKYYSSALDRFFRGGLNHVLSHLSDNELIDSFGDDNLTELWNHIKDVRNPLVIDDLSFHGSTQALVSGIFRAFYLGELKFENFIEPNNKLFIVENPLVTEKVARVPWNLAGIFPDEPKRFKGDPKDDPRMPFIIQANLNSQAYINLKAEVERVLS